MAGEIAEADLQRWFEEKSRQQEIANFIVNAEVLNTIPKWQRKDLQASERARLAGIDKAKKVFNGLLNARYLSGNRSVSVKGHTQLRPDLIMITEDANYVLVELKTRKETERQAVQELLAYSAAMKMQLPFTNEFMFIVVAFHWDTLLKFSVQSLIMDGKFVLPLALELCRNGAYQLRIQQSLFDFGVNESYDPYYAMVPHTRATAVPRYRGNDYNASKAIRRVERYFRNLAFEIAADCRKAKQSGFIILWRNEFGLSSDIISLTVATVNQFWEYSEHLHGGIALQRDVAISGIKRVQQNAAKILRDEIYAQSDVKREMFDELEDIFLSAEAWQVEASLYAQSSFSFDLLERHIDHVEEDAIKETGVIQQFEHGGSNNLNSLLLQMGEIRFLKIEMLLTFGDLTDFLHKKNSSYLWLHPDFTTFKGLMDDFRNHKLSG